MCEGGGAKMCSTCLILFFICSYVTKYTQQPSLLQANIYSCSCSNFCLLSNSTQECVQWSPGAGQLQQVFAVKTEQNTVTRHHNYKSCSLTVLHTYSDVTGYNVFTGKCMNSPVLVGWISSSQSRGLTENEGPAAVFTEDWVLFRVSHLAGKEGECSCRSTGARRVETWRHTHLLETERQREKLPITLCIWQVSVYPDLYQNVNPTETENKNTLI